MVDNASADDFRLQKVAIDAWSRYLASAKSLGQRSTDDFVEAK